MIYLYFIYVIHYINPYSFCYEIKTNLNIFYKDVMFKLFLTDDEVKISGTQVSCFTLQAE